MNRIVMQHTTAVITARVALVALALALAVASLPAQPDPPPAGDETGAQVSQPLDFPLAEAIAATRVYYLVMLVLWLSAAAFFAGLVIGIATEKRAGLWATLAVGGFLCAVWITGGAVIPQVIYVPTVLVGALLVLSAGTAGGLIGQYVWRGLTRRRASSGPQAQG